MTAPRVLLLVAFVGFVAVGAVVLGSTLDRPVAADGVVTAVSAGGGHTCALTSPGSVLCWGANHDGQLGDGEGCGAYCTAPVALPGLGSAVAVSIGDFHSCALTTAGGVKCWGRNDDGQLGDGTVLDRASPVDVAGLDSGVTAISAGSTHTCAITATGGVMCWGANPDGRLGDGTVLDRAAPVDVAGLDSGVIAIAAGNDHTCALTAAGGVKCWGANYDGRLGDGATANRTTPIDVSGLDSGVTAISAGDFHTCAVTLAGGVVCWGYNVYGALGDGSTSVGTTPGGVSGLDSGVATVAAGKYHTCAVTQAGGVTCWGQRIWGPPSEGAFTVHTTPAGLSALRSGIAAITSGDYHDCVITEAGRLKCWGYNSYGQLGNGGIWTRTYPVEVAGLDPKAAPIATFTPSSTPLVTLAATQTPTIEPTATDTPSPTDTPTATETPAPSSTPTRTSTATPQLRKGDANGNGVVNAVDATLILQFAAGLQPSVTPSADVNHDGRVDSLDATLILQSDAGLLT